MKQFKRVGNAVRRGSSFLTPKSSSSTPSLEASEAELFANKVSPSPSVSTLSQPAQPKSDSRTSSSVTPAAQSRAESPVRSSTDQAPKAPNSTEIVETPAVNQDNKVVVEPADVNSLEKDDNTTPTVIKPTQIQPAEVPSVTIETPTPIPANAIPEQVVSPPKEELVISSEQPAAPDLSPGTTDDVPAPSQLVESTISPTIEEIVPQNSQIEVARPIIEDQALATQQALPEDRKSTRLNSSHSGESRMPSSA